MRLIYYGALVLLLSGCSSIPLPGDNGWESQETKQTREHIELVREIVTNEKIPVTPNPCADIARPNKFSTETHHALYFMAISNCHIIVGNQEIPESVGSKAISELEHTRRKEIEKRGKVAGLIKDSILGILTVGADLHIASETRKSNEKVAEGNASKKPSTITVQGDYNAGDGSGSNRDNSDSSQDNDVTEDNDQTTTTEDNDQTTTTDSSTTTTSTDSSQDNDETTTTTTTTTDSSTTDSSQDNDITTTENEINKDSILRRLKRMERKINKLKKK